MFFINYYENLTTEELWDFVSENRFPITLNNIKKTMNVLNNPQHSFKSIHIAGSNGKGSTTNTLKDILMHHGFKKVGMFSSPHILHPRERMKINDIPISDEEFRPIALKTIKTLEENHLHINKPYYGGLYAMIAFQWFAENNIDIAVIEVGVGGRYDQTNIINPLVTVITNVELDHIDLLGETHHEIAFQKGGIIKSNTPCILGSRHSSVIKMIDLIATEKNAPLFKIQYSFDSLQTAVEEKKQFMTYTSKDNKFKNIELSLNGSYQCENMAIVIKTVEILNKYHQFNITEETIRHVLKTTKWSGRFEYLSDNIIVDGAHNLAGMKELVKTLKSKYGEDKYTFLYSNIETKDYRGMMLYLDENKDMIEKMFITEIGNDKNLNGNILAELSSFDKELESSIVKAFEKAKEYSEKTNTKLIICGSLYLMAKIKEYELKGLIHF